MNGGLRGAAVGLLSLTTLQLVVGNPQAAGRLGGAFDSLAGLIQRAISPNVAAIPDRRPQRHADAGGGLNPLDLLPHGPLTHIPGSPIGLRQAAPPRPVRTTSDPGVTA